VERDPTANPNDPEKVCRIFLGQVEQLRDKVYIMENQQVLLNARSSVRTNSNPWWKLGVNQELIRLVENGRIKPCRAIELGSGAGKNLVFLAKYGFDVTGIENTPVAIELGRKRLKMAGVSATLIQDDIAKLKNVQGVFDLLVDLGQMHDLNGKDRDGYVESILPLTHPGSQFLLYCYEWKLYWWERLVIRIMSKYGYGGVTFEPGEVDRRFGPHFKIARVAGESDNTKYPRGHAVYLMTRRSSVTHDDAPFRLPDALH
jgi:SAM-dependent methyltransferase